MKSIAEISLPANDRRAIAAAHEILRHQFPVTRIVLFGSKARGGGDAESDIDLLVLTSRKCTWQEKEAMIAALGELQRLKNIIFSLLIVPEIDWVEGIYQALPIRDEIDRDRVAA